MHMTVQNGTKTV